MPQPQGSAAGGRKLRMIRERQGLNQFALELDGVITQANYSNIERGRAIPSRSKLEAILEALQANFNERRETLSAFGYLPPYPLPEAHEIEAARQRCRPVLDTVPMPAYLMDFVTRLFAWNDCFARLLGVHEQSGVLAELQDIPLFKAQFDSRVRLGKYLEEIETYLLAEAQSIRDRLAPYQEERWYAGFVAQLCREPEFQRYWQATQNTLPKEEMVTEFAARALQPVRFTVPGFDTQMHFYANLDALVGDDRFRMVYLIPADAFTLRQVERWLA
jgi:transcriptional regulator with XRE-family HTH domain